MSATATAPVFSLDMKRRINATRDKVFRAWTTVDELKKWWGPEGFSLPEAELDLRVGGKYRFAMQEPTGVVHWLTGEFREIASPAKLVYTWLWEGAPEEAATLVTVEFHDAGTATDVVVKHERFSSEAEGQSHNEGWTGCLNRLELLFG